MFRECTRNIISPSSNSHPDPFAQAAAAGATQGMMDFPGMLNNPAMMNMATQLLSDPNMQNMMGQFMQGGMASAAQQGGGGGGNSIEGLLQA